MLGPYKNYGNIPLGKLIQENLAVVAVLLGLGVFVFLSFIYILFLNFKLRISKEIVEEENQYRLKAEQKLKDEKNKAERIYQLVPSAIFTVDKEQKITSWNKKAEEITGFSKEEVIDKNCLLFSEYPCKDGCGLFSSDITKPIIAKECTIRRKDGMVIDISKNVDVLKDEFGDVIGGIESFEDITNRKEVEKIISKELVRNESLVNAIGQIVYEHYFPDDFIVWSGSYEEVLGYTQEEMGTDSSAWLHRVHPDDLVLVKQKLDEAVSKVHNFSMEYRFQHKQGHYIWFRDRGVVTKSLDGKLSNIGLMENITERKEYEQKILSLSRAVEQSPSVVVITDLNGDIEYVNPKFVEVTGYSLDEVAGKNPRILKSGEHSDEDYKNLWKTISSGNEWKGEFQNKRKDGTLYWEYASISAIRNAKGEIIHYLKDAEDITKRKEAERQVREAIEIKTQFLSMVSHELRTPLTAIKEGIDIVTDGSAGSLNQEQAEFLDMAKRNVDRLARMINSVLDFQKLQAGRVILEEGDYNINQIINDVYDIMLPIARGKNIELVKDISDNLPIVRLDRDKIIQVLTNIVNNAIKFTDQGKVIIRSYIDGNNVCVAVSDTGPGIREEDKSKLFSQFSQLSTTKDKNIAGSGLGLAICKEIMLLHKGKIWFSSDLGKGTTFFFSLPIVERRG